MVSLCLTKPRIGGRISTVSNYSDRNSGVAARLNSNAESLSKKDATTTAKKKIKEKSRSFELTKSEKQKPLNPTFFRRKSIDFNGSAVAQNQRTSDFNSKPVYSSLPPQKRNEKLVFYREESTENRRDKMFATVQAMGGSSRNRRTSSRNRRRFVRQYSQLIPDANKDRYSVHKWRLKSGRVLDANPFTQRPTIKTQQKWQKLKHVREAAMKTKQPENLFQNVQSRYLLKTLPADSVLKGKEELFGVGAGRKDVLEQRRSTKHLSYLPRLRNQLSNWNNFDLLNSELHKFSDAQLANETNEPEKLVSYFSSINIDEKVEHLPDFPQKRRLSETLTSRHDVLPPILPSHRRQSYPMRQRSYRENKARSQSKRKASVINSGSSPMAIPEHEIINPSSIYVQRKDSVQEISGKNERMDNESMEYAKGRPMVFD